MRKQQKTKAGALTIVLLAAAVMLLMPVASPAGDLDPSAAPGATMKTLDEIPPTWSQILPANDGPDNCTSSRFQCVMGGEAVLDKETGLVWARDANYYSTLGPMTWYPAQVWGYDTIIGGRRGWRIPTIDELASLVDATQPGQPKLPSGHPFINVQSAHYWSSTTFSDVTDNALGMNVYSGYMANSQKASTFYVWPVRGGN